MTYHMWGDEKVDWDAINQAADYIGRYCTKYGRFMCHTKEKYGTVRASTHFLYISIHHLMYPAYCWSRFPKWLRIVDNYLFCPYHQIYWNSGKTGLVLPIHLNLYQKGLLLVPNTLLKLYHKCALWLPNKLWYKYQFWIYNRAYQNAIKRWPHILIEILEDADYSELIKNYDDLVAPYRNLFNVEEN